MAHCALCCIIHHNSFLGNAKYSCKSLELYSLLDDRLQKIYGNVCVMHYGRKRPMARNSAAFLKKKKRCGKGTVGKVFKEKGVSTVL